jgi:hypothetical protein
MKLSHIIYDRIAIAFVVVTQVVHSAVVHGVKYALFSMPWTDEHQAKRNQRFRRDAINVVARTVYLSDDGKPATPGKVRLLPYPNREWPTQMDAALLRERKE